MTLDERLPQEPETRIEFFAYLLKNRIYDLEGYHSYLADLKREVPALLNFYIKFKDFKEGNEWTTL